jgi:hypothetical protein
MQAGRIDALPQLLFLSSDRFIPLPRFRPLLNVVELEYFEHVLASCWHELSWFTPLECQTP